MVAEDIIAALQLPEQARVNQRVSKKLLIDNLAPTAADRQQINEGIEEVQWVAALKPGNCGIPVYRDVQREYVEVAVLHLILRPDARAGQLAELLHRAVPHPALLLISQQDSTQLSLAHKRWAQNEAGKVVLAGELVGVDVGLSNRQVSELMAAMVISQQPRSNLYGLYQGWIDTLQAFQIAQRTGRFHIAESQAAASARHYVLQTCIELEAKIAALRAKALKERQIARQVEVNMQIHRLQIELNEAQAKLHTP